MTDIQMMLPSDILTHVLSDYLSYDDLCEVEGEITGLILNENRIKKETTTEKSHGILITYESTYIDDKLRYKKSIHDKHGATVEESFDELGNLHGEIYATFNNGKDILYQYIYEHGKKHGPAYYKRVDYSWPWDEHWVECTYKDDEYDGDVFVWDVKYNLVNENNYYNGRRHGVQKEYKYDKNHERSTMICEVYEYGELQYKHVYNYSYDNDGEKNGVQEERKYENDQLCKVICEIYEHRKFKYKHEYNDSEI